MSAESSEAERTAAGGSTAGRSRVRREVKAAAGSAQVETKPEVRLGGLAPLRVPGYLADERAPAITLLRCSVEDCVGMHSLGAVKNSPSRGGRDLGALKGKPGAGFSKTDVVDSVRAPCAPQPLGPSRFAV